MTTPAQAGQANFVKDWPVQGPTNQQERQADCQYAQKLKSSCVDCEGPMKNPFLGEQLFLGNSVIALGAPGDPDVWPTLSSDQQAWVGATLVRLNEYIINTTGTRCATWGPAISAASGCFQAWFNKAYANANPPGIHMPLRTDGVFDQDTFWALMRTVTDRPSDFPTPFPGTPGAAAAQKKLSTGAVIGIVAAAAAGIGGIGYLATRKGHRRRSS